jgi:hypothetical protein
MPSAEVRRRNHWILAAKDPALAIWTISLALTPVHVVRSGLPQPGDWLVVLMLPVTLIGWRGVLDRGGTLMIRALIKFTVWVCVVNLAWAIILWMWDDPKNFVIHPAFYIFNASVFLCALILARRDREAFLRITVDVVYYTIVVLFLSSFVYGRDAYRGQLFFNSPNQLGYYALLAACLFVMAQRPLAISRTKIAIGVTFCAYLALLSASRASVAGILMLVFVLFFASPRTIILASLASVALVSIGGPLANALEVSQTRVERGQHRNMSFAEERGYDRIAAHPEFLLTGAGEGAYERFVGPGQARRELHSSFGTVVFSYGVVGVVLFGLFGFQVVRGASLRMMMILVPSLVFTIAHQGLRFTLFWVVIAAFAILKSMPDATKKNDGARALARS